ncbi:UCH-domain-containing protein [Poronia punctata]|nr:UCH-domain-containing protein [Poronia punctata]
MNFIPGYTNPKLLKQLAAKTSSLKKRKITTRQTARNDQVGPVHSPDIPLQSCERDSDPPNFSFTSSSFEAPASPAYLRADSIPPASSLPPRLQTGGSTYAGTVALTEDGSSVASSPSGAYADLTINSDRGADTPAPDYANNPRGSSPFTKTTHHRAIMGGAAEFPERSSSPLKRRASSMERDQPATVQEDAQDGKEDVDMISAPHPDGHGAEAGNSSASHRSSSDDIQGNRSVGTSATSVAATTKESSCTYTHYSPSPRVPASVETHISTITALVEKFNTEPLMDGQECYIVSRKWLECVPGVPSIAQNKQTTADISQIPPVDNGDIIEEIIEDPCVGSGVVDVMKKKFVRLKKGYGTEQFVPFPVDAWGLLMEWPGLKEGQIPIRRTATDNSANHDGSNVQIEFHPLVLTIHRLWTAHSQVPVDASIKANHPPPARLARSSNMKFQAFLKQAKAMAKIDLAQRVRAWQVLKAPEPSSTGLAGPTPPGSPMAIEDQTGSKGDWDHLLLDVETFTALERNSERLLVEFADLTPGSNQAGGASRKAESNQTLRSLGIAQDQPIVLDPHEEGTQWTSNYIPLEITALPTRNSTSSLTALSAQNAPSQASRANSTLAGPTTRGRSTKSGRTLGCVGLSNLGNTCYMNAALQCVRSVEELTKYFLAGEWEKELNKANVLAHNGEVASSYAQLLKDIYKDSAPGAVAPRQFKNTIGRYASQFAGYGQQDSQEFLGFLLDGLQEDLSRVKKKPYIEKPDSTDEMIGDPEAIRKMADEVWDITRKRDDSVIADLFTGLYKSTLVCPVCDKVSITFDPFNNLTLQLPIANKWSHTFKFSPLNSRPFEIKVEVDKHDTIKTVKEFISSRTGIPVERLHGSEEFSRKFYKHYTDSMIASEEITNRDNAWIFEVDAKPSNFPGTNKSQKYRSLLDDGASEASAASWDDEQAANLLVPVIHRKPATKRNYSSHKWENACMPHFIMVTPKEARSEDIIRRKILEKVATLSKHEIFSETEESEGSESTEPEMIGPNGSDTASSVGSKVKAQSVRGEDDIVDVQMKDASDIKNSGSGFSIHTKKPSWVDPDKFLPPNLQNLFDLCIYSETSSPMPTGTNAILDDRDYPKLSSRAPAPAPAQSPSSEDQFDNATNGTASNDESSSDELPRRSVDRSITRMNEESDEDSAPPVKSYTHRPKPGRGAKVNTKLPGGRKKMKPGRQYGTKGKKRMRQQRQQQEKQQQQQAMEYEEPVDDPVPDGGPLIRLREGIVVEWSTDAYDEIFGPNGSLETWDSLNVLPDPDLEKAQEARARRRKRGVTLDECLNEFERDEVLSEQDMWYCPRCKEHRRASKKLDLWKTPDILIIHLKRFSSSGYRRDKLETFVDFPTENLDIASRVLRRDDGKKEIYDLIGVDCHYGGLGGGHYTAYAKNFVDGQWYSYNDSVVSKTTTDRIVDSSAYMLFYRRQSDIPLGGPNLHRVLERFASNDGTHPLGEGRRLDEGFSRNGSSSASQGAGVSHLPANNGGDLNEGSSSSDTFNNVCDGFQRGRDDAEEDEAIELEDTEPPIGPSAQPFAGISSWSFENLQNGFEDSPLDSGAASDEAQHDSSGDEQNLSSPERLVDSIPGVSEYQLSDPQALDHTQSSSFDQPLSHDSSKMTDIANRIHEVRPEGEYESQSDDAAEIHLDETDKIGV